jgi:GTP-binding protein of the ras superfamily involved in termination of M-phase
MGLGRYFLKIQKLTSLGQKEFMSMLDLVCTDSAALFFMFDLSRPATLQSVKEWYIQSRKYNKKAVPFLIGTKYDKFLEQPQEQQAETTDQARKYAQKMKCPLVFCSAAESINIKKLFKLVIAKVFDLKANVEQITNVGEPILEYEE